MKSTMQPMSSMRPPSVRPPLWLAPYESHTPLIRCRRMAPGQRPPAAPRSRRCTARIECIHDLPRHLKIVISCAMRPPAMTDTDLAFTPATELAAAIRAKRLSPVELTEAILARIEQHNPALNAFVTLMAEPALEQARAAERAVIRRRTATQPTDPIPILFAGRIFGRPKNSPNPRADQYLSNDSGSTP